MALAQQLYEGIDVGEGGAVGLITYMRTDSTNVSDLAQGEARQFIATRYGNQFLPKEAPKYKTKARGAQEAHEAIRPTSVMRQPESLKSISPRPISTLPAWSSSDLLPRKCPQLYMTHSRLK
jgi:DNA topoisomerase-1